MHPLNTYPFSIWRVIDEDERWVYVASVTRADAFFLVRGLSLDKIPASQEIRRVHENQYADILRYIQQQHGGVTADTLQAYVAEIAASLGGSDSFVLCTVG